MLQKDGSLLWIEGRPQEAGRNVMCKYDPDDANCSERKAVDITPEKTNVRTRVHEYGGAAVTQGLDDTIFYSEFTTQRLMKLIKDAAPEPVTPDGERFRFADGVGVVGSDRLVMVREDHEKPEPANVVNEVVSVPTSGDGEMKVLATGRDFYAAPRVSPDGAQLAYIAWNHPNMPWDATELRLVSMTDDASANTDDHELVSNDNGDTSVLQPIWHPTTGELFYLSDETGYYNIHKAGKTDGPVMKMEHDLGGRAPGWSLGQQGFTFLNDGRLAAVYTKDGKSVLLLADVTTSPPTDIVEYGMDDGLPMQFGSVETDPTNDDTLYFMGGNPASPGGVYKWSLSERSAATQLCSSSTLSIPEGCISVPKAVEFPCPMGKAYGYYYAPANDGYTCTTEEAPPLLVKAHGGPTAATSTGFNPGIQYWTSRGFAVLDVDYGGSTGYGRDYRRRLRGNWGIVDIDDVCAGAQYLVKEGLADPKRLAIDGGSAGGYTTLGALAFKDVFTAGCSLYGVASLEALASDTHKFESRYLDGLVGKYPEEKAIYKERAPIESVDSFNCPILLLQGDEDKIVPPNQAETMHAALLEKGIPTALKMYVGEQHGFRKAENIEDALDSELYFYSRVFGFEAKGVPKFEIDNLKE
jgi:dipeptidyl aminopeptidase/acylaminoacyl peptidase